MGLAVWRERGMAHTGLAPGASSTGHSRQSVQTPGQPCLPGVPEDPPLFLLSICSCIHGPVTQCAAPQGHNTDAQALGCNKSLALALTRVPQPTFHGGESPAQALGKEGVVTEPWAPLWLCRPPGDACSTSVLAHSFLKVPLEGKARAWGLQMPLSPALPASNATPAWLCLLIPTL